MTIEKENQRAIDNVAFSLDRTQEVLKDISQTLSKLGNILHVMAPPGRIDPITLYEIQSDAAKVHLAALELHKHPAGSGEFDPGDVEHPRVRKSLGIVDSEPPSSDAE